MTGLLQRFATSSVTNLAEFSSLDFVPKTERGKRKAISLGYGVNFPHLSPDESIYKRSNVKITSLLLCDEKGAYTCVPYEPAKYPKFAGIIFDLEDALRQSLAFDFAEGLLSEDMMERVSRTLACTSESDSVGSVSNSIAAEANLPILELILMTGADGYNYNKISDVSFHCRLIDTTGALFLSHHSRTLVAIELRNSESDIHKIAVYRNQSVSKLVNHHISIPLLSVTLNIRYQLNGSDIKMSDSEYNVCAGRCYCGARKDDFNNCILYREPLSDLPVPMSMLSLACRQLIALYDTRSENLKFHEEKKYYPSKTFTVTNYEVWL